MIDPGIFSVGAILVAIFGSIIIFIWQTNSLSGKLESKIETQGKELRAEIETRANRLEDEIKLQGRRLSDSELEQARLNGINSVLTDQTHTHETLAD